MYLNSEAKNFLINKLSDYLAINGKNPENLKIFIKSQDGVLIEDIKDFNLDSFNKKTMLYGLIHKHNNYIFFKQIDGSDIINVEISDEELGTYTGSEVNFLIDKLSNHLTITNKNPEKLKFLIITSNGKRINDIEDFKLNKYYEKIMYYIFIKPE